MSAARTAFAAIAVSLVLAACESPPMPPPASVTHCFSVTSPKGNTFTWKKTVDYQGVPTSWSTNASEGQCWQVTFTDASGNVIGSQTGEGAAAGPTPAGTQNVDVTSIPCPSGKADLSSPVATSGGTDARAQGAAAPVAQYAVIADKSTKTGLASALAEVVGSGSTYALGQAHAALELGIGAVAPIGTVVHGLFTVEAMGARLLARAGSHGLITMFVVEVDGVPVVDAVAGLNGTISPATNGWTVAETALPVTLVSPGTTIAVHMRSTSNDELPMDLVFAF